jgi:WD40 repeat protein
VDTTLAVARRWPKERSEELDPAEIAWIRDAIRKNRIRRTVLGLIGLAFSALAAVAAYQMRANIRSDATAKSRSLSVVSEQNVADDPSIALDLAIQAAQTAKTTEAEAALSHALSRHTLLYEIGHPDTVYSIELSSDGTTVATRLPKNLVKLWKLKTRESYSFSVHTGEVELVDLSDDGTRLFATAYTDKTGSVSVWEVNSGKQLLQFTDHEGRIRTINVSRDGGLLLTGGIDRSGP